MKEHTLGPWRVAGESIITEDDTHCIAVIESDGGYEAPLEQRKANAHLIAAAPELLSSTADLLAIVEAELASDPEPEDLPSWKRTIDAANAAIKKAGGAS